jgi:predicted HicB family RNase H-like nuclease
MMKNYKVPTNIRIDENIHAKIKYIAEEERRSLNSAVEFAVEQYIKSFEEKHGEILIPKKN